jgi:hypothetical protein
MSASCAIGFVVKEFREVLPPIAFFFVTFNLLALVVGKAVLVADAMSLLRRFDVGPMIRPILFKTVVYWAVVFVARLLKEAAEYWIGGGNFSHSWNHLVSEFSWHRFAAIQIWIFVLFLVYAFIVVLNGRLGKGELVGMVLGRASAKPSLANP